MLINKDNLTHPAYLICGTDATAIKELTNFFKAFFCSSQCNSCVTCKKIDERQHHSITVIDPENRYTNAIVEIIFQKTAFANDINEKHFFVLLSADTLGINCSNSLLKLLEEPPSGFYFFLVAKNREEILPTIASRCITLNLEDTLDDTHLLLPYFLNKLNISDFSQMLDVSKITERSAVELTEQIYSNWVEILKDSINQNNKSKYKSAEIICDIIDALRTVPPMPGSAKIYLRNLYLQIVSNL